MRRPTTSMIGERTSLRSRIASIILAGTLASSMFTVPALAEGLDEGVESPVESAQVEKKDEGSIDLGTTQAIGSITVEADGEELSDIAAGIVDEEVVEADGEAMLSSPAEEGAFESEVAETEEAESDARITAEWNAATSTLTIVGEGIITKADVAALVVDVDGTEVPFESIRGDVKTLKIGEGISSIAPLAFSASTDGGVSVATNLVNMTSLVLPTGLTTIGEYAFSGNGRLVTIAFPASLSFIGDWAFQSCLGLSKVDLDVRGDLSIGECAFYGDTGIQSISVSSHTGDVSIGNRAFAFCVNATKLSLSSLVSLGQYAFWSDRGLVSVSIEGPAGLEASHFYECSSLESLVLDGASSIGANAFYNNPTIKSIDLRNIGTIAKWAFYGYTSAGTYSALETATLRGVEKIDTQAFIYCTNLEDVLLEDVKLVGQQAFFGCTGLTAVHAQDVSIIGPYAFQNCANLASFEGLATVGRIDGFAFYNCPSLKGLTIDDMTKMGFNGNYADINARVEAILKGEFKLDAADEIEKIEGEQGWESTTDNRDAKWNSYENGTQVIQQARWVEGTDSTVAEVKIDAYFTAKKQMDYVFVVDLSASMAALGNVNDANARFYDMQSKMLDVTEQLLGSEGYDCRVAFVTFGGEFDGKAGSSVSTPYYSSASDARAFIEGLKPYFENTDYTLGLTEAKRLVGANAGRETNVVFLSDGQPTSHGATKITQDNRAEYLEIVKALADEIKASDASVYGVLQSVSLSELAGAEEAMKTICSEGLFFSSVDTKSFSDAVNLAISSVYPTYTISIPVGDDFEGIENISVSASGGSAHYDIDSDSIIWTLNGMPFTKHTLTFNETLKEDRANLVGAYDFLNNGAGSDGLGATISVDGSMVNMIKSTVLSRESIPAVVPIDPTPAPAPTPTPVTVVPGGPAPVTPPAPADGGAAPADAGTAAVAAIDDDATPMAEGETIEDDATPLSAFDEPECWVHILMIIGIVLTIVYGLAVVGRRLGYTHEIDRMDKGLTASGRSARRATHVRSRVHSA